MGTGSGLRNLWIRACGSLPLPSPHPHSCRCGWMPRIWPSNLWSPALWEHTWLLPLHAGLWPWLPAHARGRMPGWVSIRHWVICGGDRQSSNGLTFCWLQMWTNAGTSPSAGPMPCARTCLVPSSASVTRATRGRGMGVTAWVRGSGAGGQREGKRLVRPCSLHRSEWCELWGCGI